MELYSEMGIDLDNQRDSSLSSELKLKAADAAIRGLNFMMRHQNKNEFSADAGRYAADYDFNTTEMKNYTGNWMTAISIEAMLVGWAFTNDNDYYDSACMGVNYLKSLQEFAPEYFRLSGVFHEETPQSPNAYPRDALTAAWALMDWADATGDKDSFNRAIAFADWFAEVGMEPGYPYWQVRFDEISWEPAWYGSFHSGSAYFLGQMYNKTGNRLYRQAMKKILDHFNTCHLDDNGKINVIIDRASGKVLDGIAEAPHSNRLWETMHVYNDDFGSLANLLAWQIEETPEFLSAAKRFLQRMVKCQRDDGGFGPDNFSVPSAAGTILLELLASIKLGYNWVGENTIERAINYLFSLQVNNSSSLADGAFCEPNEKGIAQDNMIMRTQAYSVISLLYFAGADSDFYFVMP